MRARDQSSIFSTGRKFRPDYGLLLELHALTLVARSYALLLPVWLVRPSLPVQLQLPLLVVNLYISVIKTCIQTSLYIHIFRDSFMKNQSNIKLFLSNTTTEAFKFHISNLARQEN